MKKTFQINLGNQSFTIEEDAYQSLKSYLDSLKNYFSTIDSHQEIIDDIESRIAEKFFEKVGANGVITEDLVENVVTIMGRVSDFEAFEDETEISGSDSKQNIKQPERSKSWYRDNNRKLLGGVLAGLAHRFNWDVVWLRVFYLIFVFGSMKIQFNTPSIGPSGKTFGLGYEFSLVLIYVILWIVLPSRDNLEDSSDLRKFYRNPENKRIGGVASGLAGYLNISVRTVRLIFIVTGIFAIGILVYILIWALSPEADSMGKQLQLQGRPVTIENIDRLVKQKVTSTQQTSAVSSSGMLGAFTGWVENFFSFLRKLFGPLSAILRVFCGLILVIIGVSILFSAITLLVVLFGLLASQDWIASGSIEMAYLSKEVSNLAAIFGFFALFIPGLVLLLLGIMLIIGRRIGNKNLWLVLLALWLVSFMGSITSFSQIISRFSKEDTVETTLDFSTGSLNNLIFEINDVSGEEYFKPKYKIVNGEGDKIYVRLIKSSRGASNAVARENAAKIIYNVQMKNDTLFLDENLSIPDKESFRDQKLSVEIQVPEKMKFRFGDNFNRRSSGPNNRIIVSEDSENDLNFRNYFIHHTRKFNQHQFKIDENDVIICLDCIDE